MTKKKSKKSSNLLVSKEKSVMTSAVNLRRDIENVSGILSTAKEKIKPDQTESGHLNPTPELTTFGGIKLGWIQGVLIPCLLNIWGVMLFLRISWIVGQAGIGFTIAIIFISGIVCTITTLSLSAICTNGELEGGGVYFLVSRSLGAELGASVGIIFAFANAVAASMNTIGFCDSLNELLKSHGLKILDNSSNDTRIVGSIALLVMCIICAVGMDWETKTQNILIVIIIVAIVNFIIGALVGPLSDNARAKGFAGISLKLAKENWVPDYRPDEKGTEQNFFTVFAMYFPAVTGVQAGANICGDLRNPAVAIPKGTLLAVLISLTSYLVMAVLCGLGTYRDASGVKAHIKLDQITDCKPNCPYGLHNNYEVTQLMSLWAPLIYTGCWAATLSTALTNLLSVPRLIQALGFDRIYPGLIFFSKPYGRHGEPYRGYVLTYLVSLGFLLIADLNAIAPLITNFYLASYALINFCTFHAGLVESLSWRPSFKIYNKWISLMGFMLCIGFMVIISWIMALVTTFIFITLYLMVLYTKPEASWGSSTETQRYHDTVNTILHMSHRARSIKTYIPQLLVLSGKPWDRPALVDIGNLITQIGSFMIVTDIESVKQTKMEFSSLHRKGEDWIISRKYRGFFILLNGFTLSEGLQALLQCSGLGSLSPNIVLLGFLNKWETRGRQAIREYVDLLRIAFEAEQAVAILRPLARLEESPLVGRGAASRTTQTVNKSEAVVHTRLIALMHSDSDISQDHVPMAEIPEEEVPLNDTDQRRTILTHPLCEPLTFEEAKSIDAWWLHDDGGLSILLPYLLARRGFKEKRTLRIFAISRSVHRNEDAKQCMEQLLGKFRIEYNQLTMLEGVNTNPSEASLELFNTIVRDFKTSDKDADVLITEAELRSLHAKSCRYMRLRELLLENSTNTSLIVLTLPIPRQGKVSPYLYMTWLEILSRNLPSILFVRGKSSVLDT